MAIELSPQVKAFLAKLHEVEVEFGLRLETEDMCAVEVRDFNGYSRLTDVANVVDYSKHAPTHECAHCDRQILAVMHLCPACDLALETAREHALETVRGWEIEE